jgi:hypothetical protein
MAKWQPADPQHWRFPALAGTKGIENLYGIGKRAWHLDL